MKTFKVVLEVSEIKEVIVHANDPAQAMKKAEAHANLMHHPKFKTMHEQGRPCVDQMEEVY